MTHDDSYKPIQSILTLICEQCETLHKYASDCLRYIETFQKKCEIIRNYPRNDKEDYEALQAAESFFYYHFLRSLIPLYTMLNECFNFTEALTSVAQESQNKVNSEMILIGCGRTEKSLFVKLPYLPKKLTKLWRSNLFRDDLVYWLNKLRTEHGMPDIKRKTIYVIHLFNTKFPTKNIPDNDNYDIKVVVDTICDFIGNGDDALNCRFVMESIQSDEVIQGTYIVVNPFDDNIFRANRYINVFKKLNESIEKGETFYEKNYSVS